jgi:hypothetical protein
MTGIVVRQAREEDVARLVEVEKQAWGHFGTDIYTRDHFVAWLDVHRVGFLVAEFNGLVVGYIYGQLMNFELSNIPHFTSCNEITDFGYTRKTHNPNGNSLYGISVVSVQPGAGRMLNKSIFALTEKLRKQYYFGFPRLSNFDLYMKELERSSQWYVAQHIPEEVIALWYAIECAKMVGGKIWTGICYVQPDLELPLPKIPDPVLCSHLKSGVFGIVRIIKNFMKDPSSRNYATLCVYKSTLY